MRTLIPVLAGLCLACAGVGDDVAGMVPTYGGYEARLEALVGRSINEAVADLGAPTGTVELAAGSRLYVWDEKSTVRTPLHGTESRDEQGNEHIVITGGDRLPLDCTTELEVDAAGIVTRFRVEGLACLSAPPDRSVAPVAPVAPVGPAPAVAGTPAPSASPSDGYTAGGAAEEAAEAPGEEAAAAPKRGRRVLGPRKNRE